MQLDYVKGSEKIGITERMIGYKIKKYNIRKEVVFKDSKE
jgi:hypothetical protein